MAGRAQKAPRRAWEGRWCVCGCALLPPKLPPDSAEIDGTARLLGEAGRPIYRCVAIEAGMLGKPADGEPLAPFRVLVPTDIGGRRCTHISDRLNQISLSCHGLNRFCAGLSGTNGTERKASARFWRPVL
jgi:hypothetical protein